MTHSEHTREMETMLRPFYYTGKEICTLPAGNLGEVPCNLCASEDWVELYPSTLQARLGPTQPAAAYACTHCGYGRHTAIVRCRRCGLVYANPRPAEQAILASYRAVEDPLYQAERAGRVLTFERHLRPLERLAGPANGRALLDVGCYTGVFVEVAARHGWQASGVEPSRWAAALARAAGLDVLEGTLESVDLPPGSYSVITLWDVIEHLANPTATLHQVYRLLEPGGWLVIHTIDIDSLFARLLGADWPWLMEMHLYYFSPLTLASLLAKTGFKPVCSHPQGRYLRLGYLVSRITALFPALARILPEWLSHSPWATRPIPVNFGDLFTLYARKI
jgi:2-polyprenyl-3-methyl-5-hydroxy-6-metoxy-1,4-benzoquinol methylase